MVDIGRFFGDAVGVKYRKLSYYSVTHYNAGTKTVELPKNMKYMVVCTSGGSGNPKPFYSFRLYNSELEHEAILQDSVYGGWVPTFTKIDDKNFTFEGADSRYVSCCVFMED